MILLMNTALQLVEYPHGDGIEVVFAGGRKKLMHKNQTDPEYPDKKGERLDGRDLIQEWVGRHPNSKYVWNKTEFDQIDVEKVDHVMGTYNYSVRNSCTESFGFSLNQRKGKRRKPHGMIITDVKFLYTESRRASISGWGYSRS